MKVGDKVKINLEKVLENYTKSLINSNNPPDYKHILWAKENKETTLTVKTVIYNSLVRVEGYEKLIDLEELDVIKER